MDEMRRDITRISDLPEGPRHDQGLRNDQGLRHDPRNDPRHDPRNDPRHDPRNDLSQSQGQSQGFSQEMMGSQQYQPLNIHKNPYGFPEPTDTQLPMNQRIGGGSGGFTGDMMQQSPPPQMNRGIHADTTAFQQDEFMIPNHIPSVKLTTDYLKEHEEKMKTLASEHKKEQYQKDLIENAYAEFQTPILIGVLFFLFQMPFINQFLFKNLSFLKIFGEDGNLNLYGLIFKSMMFGLVYFGFIRITSMV
jgi:hypothetical protein